MQRPLAITADLVANVITVDVAVGDHVAEGQRLLVMESMKMEIPIVAPAEGEVVELGVAVGDIVQEGDLLVALRR